jgi:O-antigen ligase
VKRFRDPALALGLFLAVAPIAAVLQYRALAPLALVALAGAALAGTWPRRPGLVTVLALGLMAWGMASALWAVEPGRSLFEGARMAALVLLAAAAGQALASGPPHRLTPWLLGGLLLGAVLAIADQQSGHWLRATVRGRREWDAVMGFGLKPAATVLALLLPLALALPISRAWKALALLLALAGIFGMPAQSAKIGVVVGLGAFVLVRLGGTLAARGIALAAALSVLLTPLLLGAVLARNPDVSAMQGSAAHRVMIWDFTLARIAERPVLGWGMEAARAIPGGEEQIATSDLLRFGLGSQREWFEAVRAQRLPLHTHNGALQIWLELGLVGAVLAAALVLALGWQATSPGSAGAFACAIAIASLSYGVWQGWWLCLLAMLALLSRQLTREPPPP